MASSGVDACDGALKKKVCKHCKKNVVNAINCINCDGSYHSGCARNSNKVKFIENGNIRCCELNDYVDESNKAFFDALNQLSDNGKIDIIIFNYIIKQKDMIIRELQDKVKILSRQLEIYSDLIKPNIKHKNVSPQKTYSQIAR